MNEPQFDRLMEVLWAICERLPAPEPRSAEREGLDAPQHQHDDHACKSPGATHRHAYRHTHPVEHGHEHEHPTDEMVAARLRGEQR